VPPTSMALEAVIGLTMHNPPPPGRSASDDAT
jgi:hypothetical protein